MSFTAVSMTQACSCDPAVGEETGCLDTQVSHNNMCCEMPADDGTLCGVGEICDEGAVVFDPADTVGCALSCTSCVPNILSPGILSQQLDATQTEAGQLVLSGYSPGDSNSKSKYGDLVFGTYDETMDEVTWQILDGVPPGPTDGVYSPLPPSWRGGQYLPGDDVGRYSSIVAAGENVLVSYEDTTHHSLKIAVRNNNAWTTMVVDDMDTMTGSSTGGALYTSIALDGMGKPVIAYGVRQRAVDANSQPTGWIRIARSADALPTATTTWEKIDLEETIVEIGCQQTEKRDNNLCHADATCVTGAGGRGVCAPTVSAVACSATCTRTQLCVEGACKDIRTLSDLEDSQGLYNNLVRVTDGFALAYYDRSTTREISQAEGTITVVAGVGGNTLVRTSGAAFTNALIGKPIRIAGLSGTRSVLTQTGGTTLTFDGTPAAATLTNAAVKFYDGTGGTVWGARFPDADANWADQVPFAIEGMQLNTAGNAPYGDCGIATSLFVDSTGVWHLAFVDGTFERLRYVTVATNNAVTGRATVDDGYPGANHRPADRPATGGERRLVGDGASIVVTSDNQIRISYQDTTRIYPVMARCSGANCTRAPIACITAGDNPATAVVEPDDCAAIGADAECNQGFCSNTAWVATAAFELPADMNASPNAGYYTVQILDALDTTNSLVAWLERALQPDDDIGITDVDRFTP